MNKLYQAIRAAAVLLVLAIALPSALACPCRAASADTVGEEQATAWRADLACLADQLPALHKNLFAKLSASEFDRAVAKLDEEIPTLAPHEITVRLEQLVAMIGDGHTMVMDQQQQEIYPVVAWWFADGAYVIQTTREHEQLLGKKLLKVNGLPMSKVEQLLGSTSAYENESQHRQKLPSGLMQANTLAALGLAMSTEETTFTVADGAGGEITETVAAVNFDPTDEWVLAGPGIPGLNKPIQNMYRHLWYPDTGVLLLEYNFCAERDDLPFSEFSKDFLDTIAANPVKRVVIDLRLNAGGDSSILDPLINKLAAMPDVNQPGNLYVLIGRATFSSAVLNAMSLRNKTDAILIGEPSGGKPNHYGEVKSFTLPNSGLVVQYSTNYFTTTEGDPDSIYPDIEASQTYADYLDGYDPALALAADGALP